MKTDECRTGKDMTLIKFAMCQRDSLKCKLKYFPDYKEKEEYKYIEKVLSFYKVITTSYNKFDLRPDQELVIVNMDKYMIGNLAPQSGT